MSLTARVPEEALPFLAALANSPDPLFVIRESPAARARKLTSHEVGAVAMFASVHKDARDRFPPALTTATT
jgi:hypothetical protein